VIFPVFIELPAGDVPSSAAVALVDACNASAAGRVCRLTASARAEESDVVATVGFSGPEQRSATVRLGLGPPGERTWQTRRLEFRPTDESTERWRSVGLVIGALAADYARPPERPPPADKVEPSATPVEPTKHPEPQPSARDVLWSIDGGLVSTTPFDQASWRAGAYARASLRPWRAPIALTTSLRYERQLAGAADFDLELGAFSAGAAIRAIMGPVGLEARLEGLRQIVVLSAHDDAGNDETRGRWHTGLRVGLDVDFRLWGSVLFVAGADATFVDAPTPIEVRNRPAGAVSTITPTVLLGLRWSSEPSW